MHIRHHAETAAKNRKAYWVRFKSINYTTCAREQRGDVPDIRTTIDEHIVGFYIYFYASGKAESCIALRPSPKTFSQAEITNSPIDIFAERGPFIHDKKP